MRGTDPDTTALTEPVDRTAVKAYRAQARAAGVAGAASPTTRSFGLIGVFVGGFAVFMVLSFVTTGVLSAIGRMGAGGRVTSALVVPVVIGVAVVAVVAIAVVGAIVTRFSRARRQYRLDRFARANGLRYTPGRANPPFPGMIFGQGGSRVASDIVWATEPRQVEFANYQYSTGSGKNRRTHHWGYVAVRLDVPLPHIVLDAKSNNSLLGSNLPAAFDRDQRLRLEGDFDQHFTLYCPRDYETDVLYLFTPDIMARFIDNAAALDVEIIDDWLFLYARRDLSTLDPATWTWLFTTTTALTDKLAQWGRWRDDKIADAAHDRSRAGLPFVASADLLTPPPPGVAPAGRRLRRGIPLASLVGGAVIVFLWFAFQSGLFTR